MTVTRLGITLLGLMHVAKLVSSQDEGPCLDQQAACATTLLSIRSQTQSQTMSQRQRQHSQLQQQPRRVVIQLRAGITGGPEALAQLALAVLDSGNAKLGLIGELDPYYAAEYPDLWAVLSERMLPVDNLNQDDTVVVPNVVQCAPIGKVQAPHIWLLGVDNPGPDGCPRLSHTHWLAQRANVRTENVLLPYLTPSMVKHAVETAGLQPDGSFKDLANLASRKEQTVLVNEEEIAGKIEGVSQELKNAGVNVIVVTGYSRQSLLELQLKAKVVLAFCMHGAERMPLESVLHGAVFFTNTCLNGAGKDDFPLSEQHRAISAEGILNALHNYEKEVMDPGQVRLRRLYGFEINRESMAQDVQRWIGS